MRHAVKINHKKDDADVKMCAAIARANGVPFKLFTLNPFVPGHMMNFCEMAHRTMVRDETWSQIMIAALGLNIPTLGAGTFHADKAWQAYDPVNRYFKPKTFQEQLDMR